jgi:hypothetical protein
MVFRDIGFSDFMHRPGIKKQTKEKTQRKHIQFPKRRGFSLVCFLILGQWIKSENPISLKVIHHRRNPIVTIRYGVRIKKLLNLTLQFLIFHDSVCT